MKKLILTLICVLSLCLLTSCDSNVSGTYKFSSMETSVVGQSVVVKANEKSSLLGVTLNENYIVLTLNADGTYTLVLDGEQTNNYEVEETGTYSVNDGVLSLTSTDGVTATGECSSNTVVLTYTVYGVTSILTLSK